MSAKWSDVVAIGTALPGVVEGTSYGTPALKVVKAFLTRYRPEDDSIVIKMAIDERDMRMEAAGDIYFITEHYRAWPAVLVRLAKVSRTELKALIARAWGEAAPRKLLKDLEAAVAAPRIRARRKEASGKRL